MSQSRRKVGYYQLFFRHKTSKEYLTIAILGDLLRYIHGKQGPDRMYNIPTTARSHKLDQIHTFTNAIGLVLKSCKYMHVPMLMHGIDGSERPSDKTLEEGDSEPTHSLLRFKADRVLIVHEERIAGMTAKMMVEYLTYFAKQFHFSRDEEMDYDMILQAVVSSKFTDELDDVKRLTVAEITVEKNRFVNEAKMFSGILDEADYQIEIKIHAKRKGSLVTAIRNLGNKFNLKDGDITRIEAWGKTSAGSPIKLDTDAIRRTQYVDVKLDPSSQVTDTKDMMEKLQGVMNEFDDGRPLLH